MKYLSIDRIVRKSVCFGVVSIMIAGQSFAGAVKPIGELLVSGSSLVTVNGEIAESGRTIFSSSTISTPEGNGAVVNMGRAGTLEMAAGTTIALNANDDVISGDLAAGSVTLADAVNNIAIRNSTGDIISLNEGETAIAGLSRAAIDHKDKTTGKCIDDDNDGKLECKEGLPAWAWYAIAGGVGAAILIAVVAGGGDDNASSPVR
ncbi:MAG: hypothetical protein WKF34_12685 [Pyrinomonadaceae bacterium]